MSVQATNNDSVIRITGELDATSVPHRLRGSDGWFIRGQATAIDLAGVERADSAGVALLLEWMRQAQKRDAVLRFHNPPAQMRAIIDFCALGNVIPRSDSSAPGRPGDA